MYDEASFLNGLACGLSATLGNAVPPHTNRIVTVYESPPSYNHAVSQFMRTVIRMPDRGGFHHAKLRFTASFSYLYSYMDGWDRYIQDLNDFPHIKNIRDAKEVNTTIQIPTGVGPHTFYHMIVSANSAVEYHRIWIEDAPDGTTVDWRTSGYNVRRFERPFMSYAGESVTAYYPGMLATDWGTAEQFQGTELYEPSDHTKTRITRRAGTIIGGEYILDYGMPDLI